MKSLYVFAATVALAIAVHAEPAKVSFKGAQVETYKVASGDEL